MLHNVVLEAGADYAVLASQATTASYVLQEPSAFAKEDQAKKDAFDESDDESAISRTESELREVTKVILSTSLTGQVKCCNHVAAKPAVIQVPSTNTGHGL